MIKLNARKPGWRENDTIIKEEGMGHTEEVCSIRNVGAIQVSYSSSQEKAIAKIGYLDRFIASTKRNGI